MTENDVVSTPAPSGLGGALKSVGPVLIRDVILPYAVYYVVHHQGVSNVSALAAGGAVNAVFVIAGLIRRRRVETLGLVVLITFVLGIAASYLTGNARFALAKDSVITGGVGIAFLASLLAARPVMYLMIRQMLSGGDPAKAAAMDARWDDSAKFRSRQRLMTAVWGAGLLGEAIVRLVVISIVPVSTGAAASTVILIATFALLIGWTRLYLPRRAAREG
ncbi:hypothetical protein GCM10023322_19650 [Rugosimonospora acidiphila]|uniref:Intracellular septation protein A n=1 Tax=Rugosimonospora acidiphila TaxID=556531 RepID=A0ABP9RNK9_9ACTN